MSSYLVTGGAGFIGSHLVMRLLHDGHHVRIVDNLVTGSRANLPEPERVDFIEADLANAKIAQKAVQGMEFVLHQAAIPSVPRSVSDPVTSHRANVDATLNLLCAARDAKVARLIFAGSSSVYGDTPTLPKHELMPTDPRSPYALQKFIGEQYSQLFTELYGLETTTIRYFNVFGPRQDPGSPYSGVISRFIKLLLAGEPPTIHGDGEQTRDFTYVDNVVDAVLAACSAPDAVGRVMNVAMGERTSLKQLLSMLSDIIGVAVEPIYLDPREGDVRDSQADCALAQEVLNYQPRVSFQEGLRRTVDWYRQSLLHS
jgi:nucleoside-diphosphate-sugar epimerase